MRFAFCLFVRDLFAASERRWPRSSWLLDVAQLTRSCELLPESHRFRNTADLYGGCAAFV